MEDIMLYMAKCPVNRLPLSVHTKQLSGLFSFFMFF